MPALRRRLVPRAFAATLALSALLVVPSTAAANEFPAGREGYHTYTEVAAAAKAVAGAVGGLAGIYPAFRAANTPPTEALRS